jgi:hypothetical protein
MRVSQWLDADDEEALQALKNPAFRVRLDLEITDYSDAESTLIEQEENAGMITDTPEGMLKEQGADAAIKYFCEAHLDYITEVEEDYGPDIFDETAMFTEWD